MTGEKSPRENIGLSAKEANKLAFAFERGEALLIPILQVARMTGPCAPRTPTMIQAGSGRLYSSFLARSVQLASRAVPELGILG